MGADTNPCEGLTLARPAGVAGENYDAALRRIRELAAEMAARPVPALPEEIYHGSVCPNLGVFDVTDGEGMGAWFDTALRATAEFAVSRAKGSRNATVYPARVTLASPLVAKNEAEWKSLGTEMTSVFGHTFTLHHLRCLLLGWGYDGIVETGHRRPSVAAFKPEKSVEWKDPILASLILGYP